MNYLFFEQKLFGVEMIFDKDKQMYIWSDNKLEVDFKTDRKKIQAAGIPMEVIWPSTTDAVNFLAVKTKSYLFIVSEKKRVGKIIDKIVLDLKN